MPHKYHWQKTGFKVIQKSSTHNLLFLIVIKTLIFLKEQVMAQANPPFKTQQLPFAEEKVMLWGKGRAFLLHGPQRHNQLVQKHIVETQTMESCFMNPCSQLEQPSTAVRGIHSRTESLYLCGFFFFFYMQPRLLSLILKTLHRAVPLLSLLPYILGSINSSDCIT